MRLHQPGDQNHEHDGPGQPGHPTLLIDRDIQFRIGTQTAELQRGLCPIIRAVAESYPASDWSI